MGIDNFDQDENIDMPGDIEPIKTGNKPREKRSVSVRKWKENNKK